MQLKNLSPPTAVKTMLWLSCSMLVSSRIGRLRRNMMSSRATLSTTLSTRATTKQASASDTHVMGLGCYGLRNKNHVPETSLPTLLKAMPGQPQSPVPWRVPQELGPFSRLDVNILPDVVSEHSLPFCTLPRQWIGCSLLWISSVKKARALQELFICGDISL